MRTNVKLFANEQFQVVFDGIQVLIGGSGKQCELTAKRRDLVIHLGYLRLNYFVQVSASLSERERLGNVHLRLAIDIKLLRILLFLFDLELLVRALLVDLSDVLGAITKQAHF